MNHMLGGIRVEGPVDHVWAFPCDTARWHDVSGPR